MYSCTPCGRSFQDQGGLNQHLRSSAAHKNHTPALPPQNPLRTQPRLNRSSQSGYEYDTTNRPRRRLSNVGTIQVEPSRPSPANPSRTPQSSNYARHKVPGQHQYGHPSNSRSSHPAQAAIFMPLQNTIPPWSTAIPASEYQNAYDALAAECHTLAELTESSYILEAYNPKQYENKRKCHRCRGVERRVSSQPCIFHTFKRNKYNERKPYKCCTSIDGKGCQTLPTHDFRLSLRAVAHTDYLPAPEASPSTPKLQAVVFDCEMAGIASGAGETILLCVIDYLTGEVIIHTYVNPSEQITQMRTEIHGVSKSTLDQAIAQGQALSGWREAREELWKYIDADTILVGHALQNDLDSLRMIHHRIVDSVIMPKKKLGVHGLHSGLSNICEELLGLELRKTKGKIHECLEDVLATREVVLFCTREKEKFQSWVQVTRIKLLELEAEKERVRQAKKREAEAAKGAKKDIKSGGEVGSGGGSEHW